MLPLGIANFAKISLGGYYYADKTKLLYELVKTNSPYFLSRPRRFGKSLLVTTLEDLLRGRRELFEGLWIGESDYDWKPYPVISLSFANVGSNSVEILESFLISKLRDIADIEELSLNGSASSSCFESLITKLYYKYGQEVAILIDEYDEPILKQITNPDLANEIRENLKLFYAVLKSTEKLRGFVFITGITKFTKASIFSGLNNLVDLTLKPKYAAICGFTAEEFDTLFSSYLEDNLGEFKSEGTLPSEASVGDLRQAIFDMYDGYSWDDRTRVLNPWSVLMCLEDRVLDDFWFQSGSPEFLIKSINNGLFNFDFFRNSHYITNRINVMEVDKLDPAVLMFQAGYLTIKSRLAGSKQYLLDLPNQEVKAARVRLFLPVDQPSINILADQAKAGRSTLAALLARDAAGFNAAFSSFLALIPYCLHWPHEGCYHLLFYMAMSLAGLDVDLEPLTGEGRSDAVIRRKETGEVFVVELKYRREAKDLESGIREAMKQIGDRKYDVKFGGTASAIHKTALCVAERGSVMISFE
jgi:hypothetical protein